MKKNFLQCFKKTSINIYLSSPSVLPWMWSPVWIHWSKAKRRPNHDSYCSSHVVTNWGFSRLELSRQILSYFEKTSVLYICYSLIQRVNEGTFGRQKSRLASISYSTAQGMYEEALRLRAPISMVTQGHSREMSIWGSLTLSLLSFHPLKVPSLRAYFAKRTALYQSLCTKSKWFF